MSVPFTARTRPRLPWRERPAALAAVAAAHVIARRPPARIRALLTAARR